MGDCLARRHFPGGALGVDVQPLVIVRDLGEGIDLRLVDFDPVADAEFLADLVEELIGVSIVRQFFCSI